jgi:hypothetical protein
VASGNWKATIKCFGTPPRGGYCAKSNERNFDSYTLFHSGHPSRKEFGTGFLVGARIQETVMKFIPVNERICYLRLRGTYHNISLIAVHAPTAAKTDGEKDGFYIVLEEVMKTIPTRDFRMVLGDFNAQVGRDRSFGKVVGPNSLHMNLNKNGERMTEFALSNYMIIASSYFPHAEIHKQTRVSTNGTVRNQIDHVLV